MSDNAWFVQVRGKLTDHARVLIGNSTGTTLTGSHGGGFAGPGGELPEMNSHTVLAQASSADEAVKLVRQVLEGESLFVDEDPKPANSNG